MPESTSPDHATFLTGSEHATQLSTDQATVLSASGVAAAPAVRPALEAGVIFGPYRIARLLGRGGLGEVYEAEHLDHGRRVALKVLSQRLTGGEDRARFLTEGRLAASMSHPNCVYVFGSEEIDGAPAITMELVAGGTLKDLVDGDGPMPPAKAVDATLQMIAGLEAAHAAGILHRDIKPSNCFVDADGLVKVGDFGLSISTHHRVTTTAPRGFQGTPQYAAPEQVAGEDLDVRADLYAVGATLYYLLTGAPPFDDRDLATLLRRVKEETPASPRDVRPAVPQGLSRIVRQLLAKRPADRIPAYGVLADKLRPFATTAPTPAMLGLRFTAGVIDHILLTLATMPFTMTTMWRMQDSGQMTAALTRESSIESPWWTFAGQLIWITYFTLMEGWGDASLGKRVCGLRVVDRTGRQIGLLRSAARTAVFMVPQWLTAIPTLVLGSVAIVTLARSRPWIGGAFAVSLYVLTAMLFVSMRRRNGYAAMHDLLTRTRVVVREPRGSLVGIDAAAAVTAWPDPDRRGIGPFEVEGLIARTDRGELLLARDPILHRQVWLHVFEPAADPDLLTPAIRDLARPGRLRWLFGRRTADEAWDAYEAPGGDRFLSLCRRPQSWIAVRHWIAELAAEIAAAEQDGTRPPLTLDRLWITRQGHAKLLDFPVDPSGGAEPAASQPFLSIVARTALAGRAAAASDDDMLQRPMPLGARTALERLAANAFGSTTEAAAVLKPLTTASDRVSRWQRAVPIALTAMPAVVALFGFLVVSPMLQRSMQPEFRLLSFSLSRIAALEASGGDERQRQALEIYVAGRYGPQLKDPGFWGTTGVVFARWRPMAERIVAAHPVVSETELAVAGAELEPLFAERTRNARTLTISALGALLLLGLLTIIGATAVLFVTAVGGSILLRLTGATIVNRHGQPASRLRLLCRGLITWSPLLGPWLLVLSGVAGAGSQRLLVPVIAAALILIAGAAWTIVRPERGLHDRLAGTWLVPR